MQVNVCAFQQVLTLHEYQVTALPPGIFGVLLNHNDMLLRRSTAEFAKSDVPM